MKIILKADLDDSDSSLELILTNEELDNPNFLDLNVRNKDGEVLYSVMVDVEELARAARVFEDIRKERKEEDMWEIDSEI